MKYEVACKLARKLANQTHETHYVVQDTASYTDFVPEYQYYVTTLDGLYEYYANCGEPLYAAEDTSEDN